MVCQTLLYFIIFYNNLYTFVKLWYSFCDYMYFVLLYTFIKLCYGLSDFIIFYNIL